MFGHAAVSIERVNHNAISATVHSETQVGQRLKFDKHRAVFRAGDDAERFFEVEEGCVMVYRILDDGRRQVVELVFAGGICGLTSGDLYESNCETLTPSVLRSHKNEQINRSDELRTKIVDRLRRQVLDMHEHAVSLGRRTAEERVCSLIVRLVEAAGSKVHDLTPCVVTLPMTRTEIADYLGLTLETVCRTLSDLVRRKLIAVGANKSEIIVTNVDRLRRAACWDVY